MSFPTYLNKTIIDNILNFAMGSDWKENFLKFIQVDLPVEFDGKTELERRWVTKEHVDYLIENKYLWASQSDDDRGPLFADPRIMMKGREYLNNKRLRGSGHVKMKKFT